MSFLYFAYGSNMLPARLVARCPSALVHGKATANGFDVEFSKESKDGSGKATLISDKDLRSPGVLFEIEMDELKALDRAEGAGYGYDRVENFSVELNENGETVSATTYIASQTNQHLKPFDWYLALVIAGAHHHGLGETYIERLRLIEHIVDAEHSRKGRLEALEALSSHGHQDHGALMSG